MNESVKAHLPAIIGITLLGIITTCIALAFVHNSAATLNVTTFEWLVFLIPCAVMLVCSFAMAATANAIGRQLYVVILVICFFAGVISMPVCSSWLSNHDVAAMLLANSPENTVIVPILNSPVTIMRDVAAFVVVPTVGCIAGAWVGSRLHPVVAAPDAGKSHSKKNKSKKK